MRWLPALILVLVFVIPLFIGGLSAVAVATFVLDRNWYVSFLSDERLYDLPEAVSGATWRLELPGLPTLPPAMGRDALKELLPPAYLRDQAGAVMDQVFTFDPAGRFVSAARASGHCNTGEVKMVTR